MDQPIRKRYGERLRSCLAINQRSHTSSGGAFVRDLILTVRAYELWFYWAWREVRGQYHRTVFGPFWITIGMAIYAIALNVIFGHLLKVTSQQFLPWVICGVVSYYLIVGIINESAQVFTMFRSYILRSDRPLLVYTAYAITRNLMVFVHHLAVALVVLLVFDKLALSNLVLMVLIFPLFLFTIGWIAVATGIVATRYRDVAPMISNVLQVAFFVTPIMFMPDMLPDLEIYIRLNPFSQYIALIREPLLGHYPSQFTIAYCIITGALGWWAAIALYQRARQRVAYWL